MSAVQQEVIPANVVQAQRAEQRKLIPRFAERYGIDPAKLLATLKATAFKQRNGEVSDEQMMSLLVVAEQYHLNPFTREIYAFPDKNNGIVPVVGVDGWSRIMNEHPAFDGMDFKYSENIVTPDMGKPCPEWVECIIHRKDRAHPIVVREYIEEVYRPPFMKDNRPVYGPWQTHTKRFLRHKTVIQATRLAFGFVGIFDQDEAERIIDAEPIDITPRDVALDVPEGTVPKRIGAAKVREIIAKLEAAIQANDGAALIKEWDAHDNEQKLFLWSYLRSWDRTAFKKLEAEARKAHISPADIGPWAAELLRVTKDPGASWAAIEEAYAVHDQVPPTDLETMRDDRKRELGVS